MIAGLRRAATIATVVGTWVVACAGAAPGSRTAPQSAAAGASPAVPSSQSPRPAQTAPAAFDSGRAFEHLTRQVAFGPRPSGSAALASTRAYLLAQLEAAGIRARLQTFQADTPLGPVAMTNIVATIPGTRADRIGIASHYDTKISRDFPFVGANDGASSTAALLELGRALAGRRNPFTIELLFLDGEEAVNWNWSGTDNTYGSRHYVEAGTRDGSLAGLKALLLLDMIGDRDLIIRRDANSTPWLVDLVWDAAARTGHAAIFSNDLTTIEDDHLPFLRAGVPSVDIIDLDNPTWHTAQDDVAHVSARSLQVVGDVVLAALPSIEQRLAGAR